ncbi:MAG: tyrosine-type recombinase/integrase [Mollicutes bacterium UO1]
MRIIPKIQPKLFPTIDCKELERLKNVPNQTNKNNNERDRLILDFFFYTGLRINELVNIRHCDYQNKSLKVHGKGNKFRFIPIPDFLTKYFKNGDNYLFQTR